MYEFMKPVKVRSLCVGGLIDEQGRFLKVIGNLPIKEGETVWTDGNIAYGHIPIKSTVKPFWADGGYPVLADGINGYIRESGTYKAKELNLKNEPNTYLMNTKNKIFGIPNDFKNRLNVIDAENIIPKYSYEKNQYYAATMSKQYFSTSNMEFNSNGKIIKGSPYVSSSELIRINTVTDSARIGCSSNSSFNPMKYCDRVVKIIIDDCKCKGGYLDYLYAQVLDFRFINNSKKWEAIVVYNTYGQIVIPCEQESYDSEYVSVELSENSFTHELESKSHFIGKNYIFKYLCTSITKRDVLREVEENPDIYVDLYNVRIIARINDEGKFEVLQKCIQTKEKKTTYIVRRYVYWLPIEECSLLYIPVDAVGEYSYYMHRIGEENSDYDTQIPAGAGFLSYTKFDMYVPRMGEETAEQVINAIDINYSAPFDVSLNGEYNATTDLFHLYDIRKDHEVILDKLECVKKAYLIEPTAYSNVKEMKKGNGWDIKKTSSDGIITYEYSSKPPGYYIEDEAQFHLLPHVCLTNINNGYLLAYRSCYLQGGLYKIVNGDKILLGEHAKNLRFNYMNRVKAFVKPENRNRI